MVPGLRSHLPRTWSSRPSVDEEASVITGPTTIMRNFTLSGHGGALCALTAVK